MPAETLPSETLPTDTLPADMLPAGTTYDLDVTTTRELNAALQATEAPASVTVTNPQGKHALACGLDRPIDVRIDGHVGYYAAGMNKQDRKSVV